MLGFGPVLVLDELRRGQDGETLRFIVGVHHVLHSATMAAVLSGVVRVGQSLSTADD